MLPCEEGQPFISGKRRWVGRSWWSALLLHGEEWVANYLLSGKGWSHSRRQNPVARQGAGLETTRVLKGEYSAWRVLSLLRQKRFCRRDICISNVFINRDIRRWEIAFRALRKRRFTALSKREKGMPGCPPTSQEKYYFFEVLMNSCKEGWVGFEHFQRQRLNLSSLTTEHDRPLLTVRDQSGDCVRHGAPMMPGVSHSSMCLPGPLGSLAAHGAWGCAGFEHWEIPRHPVSWHRETVLDTVQGHTEIPCSQV